MVKKIVTDLFNLLSTLTVHYMKKPFILSFIWQG